MQNTSMELEDSEIINLAVNIFLTVGIKRSIGHIDILRHEKIYFELYKIIFPDSMIDIFKIEQSSLPTDKKIQKIIDKTSSIIRMNLSHISGQAIAQGNKIVITNWLLLLRTIFSNIQIAKESSSGSQPDLDRENYRDTYEDDYFTVQGVKGEFNMQISSDDKADDHGDQDHNNNFYEEQDQDHNSFHTGSQPHKKSNKKQIRQQRSEKQKSISNEQKKERDEESASSSEPSNLLQPIQPNKKGSNKGKNKKMKKKVTFNIEDGQSNTTSKKKDLNKTKIKNLPRNGDFKKTAETNSTFLKGSQISYDEYLRLRARKGSEEEQILQKKKQFISKMHKIQEEMQRKKINDEIANFQNWVFTANQISAREAQQIEDQNKQRANLITEKIAERETFVSSLAGMESGMCTIKEIFRKQKQYEKRVRKMTLQKEIREAEELMELSFPGRVEQIVMSILGQ